MSRTTTVPDLRPTGAGQVVAAALLGSALVHATVVEEHLAEWALAGTFFLVLVIGETILAVAALRVWGRELAAVVAGSSLAIVAVWGVSRTVGMPFGPADFQVPEAVGAPDLVCCVLELTAVAFSLGSLRRTATSRTAEPRSVVAARALTAVVVVALVAVTAVGLRPALSGAQEQGHHHHAAE